MKPARIAILLASSIVFASCAYVPPHDGVARRVSPDYTTTGDNTNTRAYLYGNHTVLEFEGSPVFLSIKDEAGATVEYEKVGPYYRLNRRLDNFTVWVNGSSVTFTTVATTRVFSAPSQKIAAPKSEPVKLSVEEITRENQADADIAELLKLSDKQLAEVRHVLDTTGKNPRATGAELFAVSQRLDEIEARLITASAAIVRVSFPTAGMAFKPNPQQAAVLIDSAKTAQQVNVSGHTDSRVAGAMDAKIALGRANAARKYLVDNGVQPDKIKVTSQADGGFVAPNITKEGRALNRRVEIEFVNARIAELKSQTMKLASAKAGK